MKTVLAKYSMQDLIKSGYQGPVLVPVLDDLEGVPYGEVMAEIKLKRNPGNHKRFFAFVKQTFAMQDVFNEPTDIERWRRHLLLIAGHVEEHISPKTGEVAFVIKSINWDELDELEFKPIFNSVINGFIKWYGKGLTELQINSILEY